MTTAKTKAKAKPKAKKTFGDKALALQRKAQQVINKKRKEEQSLRAMNEAYLISERRFLARYHMLEKKEEQALLKIQTQQKKLIQREPAGFLRWAKRAKNNSDLVKLADDHNLIDYSKLPPATYQLSQKERKKMMMKISR